MLNSNPICSEESRALAPADQMMGHLLRVTSLCDLEDVDVYLGEIVAIVFELLAQHVDRGNRKTARSVYKAGILRGFYGAAFDTGAEAAVFDADGIKESHAMWTAIALAGFRHGWAIRSWIEEQKRLGNFSLSGDSSNAAFRKSVGDYS